MQYDFATHSYDYNLIIVYSANIINYRFRPGYIVTILAFSISCYRYWTYYKMR